MAIDQSFRIQISPWKAQLLVHMRGLLVDLLSSLLGMLDERAGLIIGIDSHDCYSNKRRLKEKDSLKKTGLLRER